MPDTIDVLLTEELVQQKVAEIGAAITRDFEGESVHLLGILRGSYVFMADLARHIKLPTTVDFIALSSYGEDTKSSGVVKLEIDLGITIHDKNVIIVEDIIDSGLTLSYLTRNLATRNPASLRICTLLSKPSRRKVDIAVDYEGFEIPDEFVVGYGLDYAQQYRNLPYVGIIRNVEAHE